MRCLYCGEPLSLLRKLTGKAEFCSEAHREAYQEEFNSLALQRLASQPKQSRRPEPVSAPAVPPSLSSSGLSGAGLPLPDGHEEEFELPVFDSPIFTGLHTQTPEVADVPPPAPLWVFLSSPSLKVYGAIPASCSTAVHLATYPRDCMRIADRTASLAALLFPEGGYVDLPEIQDSRTGPLPVAVAPLACLLTALSLPAASFAPHASGEASPRSAYFLSLAGPSGALESGFAPPVCSVALPALKPFCLPDLVHPPTNALPRRLLLSPPAACAHLTPIVPAPPPAFAAQNYDWPIMLEVPLASRPVPDAELGMASSCAADVGPHLADSQIDTTDIESILESLATNRRLLVPCLPVAAPSVSIAEAGPQPLAGKPNPASILAPQTLPGIPATHTPGNCFWTVPAFAAQREPAVRAAELIPAPTASLQVSFAAQSVQTECLPWAALVPPEFPRTFAAAASSPSPAYSAYVVTGSLRLDAEAADPALATWATFPAPSLAISVPIPSVCHSNWPASAPLASLSPQLLATQMEDEAVLNPVIRAEPAVSEWLAGPQPVLNPRLNRTPAGSTLAKVRVKDFAWPSFAAGCDSLFTADQPFRFHEMPFPHRGTSDLIVGDAMSGDMMQGLRLTFADDRFDFILRSVLADPAIEAWMSQSFQDPAAWPTRSILASVPVAPEAPRPNAVATEPSRKVTEPPGSWQQAARAMHEGQQQVHREPDPSPQIQLPLPVAEKLPVTERPAVKPVSEAKPVNAVPVIAEPVKGNEVARFTPPEPPTPFVPHEPLNNRDRTQPPANDGTQFEWRRDQPHPAPPPPPAGSSSVSINTTIVVEGNAGSGIVVENAVRISLGDRGNKKKTDAVERFADGDDLATHPIKMAPPEPLPDFVAEPPELRAVLETIASLSDSIQWPKFSVTPMRRRIAFGPAKGGIFGGSPGHAASKASTETKTPLPPKKSVGGFLFKKLTNS